MDDQDPRWVELRRQMPAARRWAYFDHAAISPLSSPAALALSAWTMEAAETGSPAWRGWKQRYEQIRGKVARLINADADEIALLHSTTEGIGLVAEGFPWQPGDNVVIPADEFPANQYAWLNLADRGVETRRVPVDEGRVDLNRIDAACDDRTRIVSISWVGYRSGWRNDLHAAAEIAHRHGALLMVDAIQALGVFPLDVRQTPIDFLAAQGQKWLLAPEGTGLFYCRREHLARLRPLLVGSCSVVHEYEYDRIEYTLKPSADRYEGGGPCIAPFVAFGASLDLLMNLGAEAIGQRLLEVTDRAIARLRETGAELVTHRDHPEHNSGIVTFRIPGADPQAVRRKLLEREIVVACRSRLLRISPHAYSNEADIERLTEALEEFRR